MTGLDAFVKAALSIGCDDAAVAATGRGGLHLRFLWCTLWQVGQKHSEWGRDRSPHCEQRLRRFEIVDAMLLPSDIALCVVHLEPT
jgi:hypothetical protein